MTREFTRRDAIATIGAGGAVALAGCTGSSGSGDGANSSGGSGNQSGGGNQSANATSGANSAQQATQPLTAGGSSTVYPITSDAASTWNSNPEAGDEDYWVPGDYDIDTDARLADYWGGLYGFDSGGSANAPFTVSVGLSHSDVGLQKVMNGQVDLGDASAPVSAELTDLDRSGLNKFKNHVVGVDAQPIVVSKSIKDAGVTSLTLQQLKDIYKGNTENWSAVGGPDHEIQAVGRVEGSGTDTAFRNNVFGNPDAAIPGVDVRQGENQQVQTTVGNSNNAIAYLALAFVDESTDPAIGLEIDGTTYSLGKNLDDPDYPLSRDLHCYTYEDTSKKEAAFLRMILSPYGQASFVEPNNYLTLSDQRRREQLDRLPSPQQ